MHLYCKNKYSKLLKMLFKKFENVYHTWDTYDFRALMKGLSKSELTE